MLKYQKAVERVLSKSYDVSLLPYERINPIVELQSRYSDLLPAEFIKSMESPSILKSTEMRRVLDQHLRNVDREMKLMHNA